MKTKYFNWQAFKKGTIPWNAHECREVIDWYFTLKNTPKDDWDLSERKVLFQPGNLKIIKKHLLELKKSNLLSEIASFKKIKLLKFNQFHPMNQLAIYMMKRYDINGPYHLRRFINIMNFICENIEKLKIEELYVTDDDGQDLIYFPLLQALCELPFSKVVIKNKKKDYVFDYDEVIKKAKDFIKKQKKKER